MTIKEKIEKEIESQIDQLHIYRNYLPDYNECLKTIEKLQLILNRL